MTYKRAKFTPSIRLMGSNFSGRLIIHHIGGYFSSIHELKRENTGFSNAILNDGNTHIYNTQVNACYISPVSEVKITFDYTGLGSTTN